MVVGLFAILPPVHPCRYTIDYERSEISERLEISERSRYRGKLMSICRGNAVRIVLQFALVFVVALLVTGCELGKEERDRLNVELDELRARRQGEIYACQLVHANDYQTWREDNADRIPAEDHMARAMLFEEEADQGWVKAWKATESQIFEMDARIRNIEMLLGNPESAD